jgi:hypothetical protein
LSAVSSASLGRLSLVAACLLALAAIGLGAPGAASAAGLQTAVTDFSEVYQGPDAALAFKRTHDAGATAVRLFLPWAGTAPNTDQKPPGFDSSNPADPQYNWAVFDQEVKLAVANGLEPIVSISDAPVWAEGAGIDGWLAGTFKPDPVEFGRFAHAAAVRYSGNFAGLPRVRYWQAWSEPNFWHFLSPQYDAPRKSGSVPSGTHIASADLYRNMVNEFTAAVHGVHADNLSIAGALSPFHFDTFDFPKIAPLRFMRALFCLSRTGGALPGCEPVHLDIWSAHPYTSGGPNHHALAPDDVSIGDLPDMRRVLKAAVRSHHLLASGRLRFWVTEFSWDTKPPDRTAVPIRLHARWVAEALYRMWRDGVSLVTWFQLRDQPINNAAPGDSFQSGLYFRCASGLPCDRPKLSLTAFRFPFVAFRSGSRVLVWGRTPGGKTGSVTVEQQQGHRWKRLAKLRAGGSGIFTRRLRTSGRGPLRAMLNSPRDASVPFALGRTRDLHVNPFGGRGPA